MFLCSNKIIIIYSVFMFVSCEDKGIVNSRKPRIFSFDAESEDVEVGLDFSIPFIKIPLKKNFGAVAEFGLPGLSLPKININPMALILGGVIIVFTSIIGPILNKVFELHHQDRSTRVADITMSQAITEQFLANSRGCPERIACWTSRQTTNPETIQTLKHIMRNDLLSSMINTTALEVATINGLKGQNCNAYSPCPIEEKTLPKLISSFQVLTNSL